MFQLVENKLMEKGYCKYRDEYNNTAFIKRSFIQGKCHITAKLRFRNKNITAEPFGIEWPIKDTKGKKLQLKFSDEHVMGNTDVKHGIKNFTQLINYWISMNQDLCLLEADNRLFMAANPGKTIENIAEYKISLLGQYEEMKEVMAATM